MTVEDSRQSSSGPVESAARSWYLLAVIVALLSLAVTAYLALSGVEEPNAPSADQLRMPAGKPLLEPDRPDLIGDPGIAADDEAQGDDPNE